MKSSGWILLKSLEGLTMKMQIVAPCLSRPSHRLHCYCYHFTIMNLQRHKIKSTLVLTGPYHVSIRWCWRGIQSRSQVRRSRSESFQDSIRINRRRRRRRRRKEEETPMSKSLQQSRVRAWVKSSLSLSGFESIICLHHFLNIEPEVWPAWLTSWLTGNDINWKRQLSTQHNKPHFAQPLPQTTATSQWEIDWGQRSSVIYLLYQVALNVPDLRFKK